MAASKEELEVTPEGVEQQKPSEDQVTPFNSSTEATDQAYEGDRPQHDDSYKDAGQQAAEADRERRESEARPKRSSAKQQKSDT